MLNLINVSNLNEVVPSSDSIYLYNDRYFTVEQLADSVCGNTSYHIKIYRKPCSKPAYLQNVTSEYEGKVDNSRYYISCDYLSLDSCNFAKALEIMFN